MLLTAKVAQMRSNTTRQESADAYNPRLSKVPHGRANVETPREAFGRPINIAPFLHQVAAMSADSKLTFVKQFSASAQHLMHQGLRLGTKHSRRTRKQDGDTRLSQSRTL